MCVVFTLCLKAALQCCRSRQIRQSWLSLTTGQVSIVAQPPTWLNVDYSSQRGCDSWLAKLGQQNPGRRFGKHNLHTSSSQYQHIPACNSHNNHNNAYFKKKATPQQPARSATAATVLRCTKPFSDQKPGSMMNGTV
jgi:hypothetical protein